MKQLITTVLLDLIAFNTPKSISDAIFLICAPISSPVKSLINKTIIVEIKECS